MLASGEMTIAALAILLLTACTSGTAAQPTISPSPTQAPSNPSPSPSPSPQPLQRVEASLPAPVEETAAAAANGNLYVMGGFNPAGASLDSVYVYDGASWRPGPRLPLPLDHPSATSFEGDVYIAGGHSNGQDSARMFRLEGGRWNELASMHFARGGHALVAVSGELYAIGGSTARGNVVAIEAYDPSANAWTTVGSLPQPRNHVMGFVLGVAACVAGGRSPTTARIDCFDTPQQLMFHPLSLPAATSAGGAATFPDGDVIVAGGEDASETRIVDQFVLFGPGGPWVSAGSMMSPRHGFQLAVYGGRAWACGGGSAPGLHPVATCTSLGDPAASNG